MDPKLAKDITLEDEISLADLTRCGRKKTKAAKFYDRTSGIIVAVKPCAIIVGFEEMITSESPTQAFCFLLNTFFDAYDAKKDVNFRYCGYDRACDLHPYLTKLAKKGNEGAKALISKCEFLVDIFHCNKHTEPCCFPPDNPECIYHPYLESLRI